MNKRSMILTLICFFLFSSFYSPLSTQAASEEKQTPNLAKDANSAILMEQDTGTILFEKDPHEKLPLASMTKVMTLLLIMEAIDQGQLTLDEQVRISENASSMGGSQVFLEAGEEMSVEDLLKSIAIASANDASVALAERISGSEEAFVEAMNDKVKELGLKNTKFKNTTGLPAEDHYSTAYDMAVISRELLKYEDITAYTSIYEDYLREGTDKEFWLVNTNKLVRFYPGVDGLKTGYTSEAKYCLAATMKKEDMRVVAVVFGYDSSKTRNAEVSSMLDYAFNHYEATNLHEQGEVITELSLLKGEERKTNIVTKEKVSTIHPKGEDMDNLHTEYELFDDLSLPIKAGDQVGTLYVKNDNEILMESPLTVEQSIEKASLFTLFKRALQKVTVFE